MAEDNQSLLVIRNIFEGLLRKEADGSLGLGVAKSYTVNETGTHYEFSLREDAVWHFPGEGESAPVTAEDFVYAFRRIFDSTTRSPYAEDFFCIQNGQEVLNGTLPAEELGIYAETPYLLVMDLEYADPLFLERLTSAPAMPCNEDFFLSTKGKYGLNVKATPANGPFYLRNWTADTSLFLKSNPNYISDSPVLADSVTLQVQSDTSRWIDGFIDQKADAILCSGPAVEQILHKGYQTESFDDTVWGLVFQLENQYFSNMNIRRALASSVNAEAWQQELPVYLHAAKGAIPPSVSLASGESYRDYAGEMGNISYNTEQAREYLNQGAAELDIASLNGLTVTIPEGLVHEEIFLSLAETWQKELGVFFAVEVLPLQEYLLQITSGDFDCAIVPLSGEDNSPESALSIFRSSLEPNPFSYVSETFNRAMDTAAKEVDPEIKAEACAEAERILLQDYVFLPLYSQTQYFALNQDVTGIFFDASSQLVDFKNAVKP